MTSCSCTRFEAAYQLVFVRAWLKKDISMLFSTFSFLGGSGFKGSKFKVKERLTLNLSSYEIFTQKAQEE